jgi:hypothetical protein
MTDTSTLEYHQGHSEISLNAHRKIRHLELSQWILQRKRVYLDTKFWLILRDAYLNRNKNSADKKLLEFALKLADQGICVFPVSEHVFLEVIKQTDSQTRTTTAELIDRLSKGISIVSFDEQLTQEILCYLDEMRGNATHRANELIWTKVSYTLGYQYPSGTAFDAKTELAIQKAFHDHMWDIPLAKMLSTIESNGGIRNFSSFPDISPNLNTGKFDHLDDHKAFRKMFLAELAGTLDASADMINGIMLYIYERDTANKATPSEIQQAHSNKTLTTMLYNLFRLNKISTELPFLKIQAGLYAAVRWDKKQKFQRNDMHDFGHATCAVPYAIVFLLKRDFSISLYRRCLALTNSSIVPLSRIRKMLSMR